MKIYVVMEITGIYSDANYSFYKAYSSLVIYVITASYRRIKNARHQTKNI